MQNQLKQIYFIVRFGNGMYVSMKVVTEIQKTMLNKFVTPSSINKSNMTVQELIDKLSKVEDKTMEVCFPYSHGTQENGEPISIAEVSVYNDCVIIYD
jgi:hypothetical protein